MNDYKKYGRITGIIYICYSVLSVLLPVFALAKETKHIAVVGAGFVSDLLLGIIPFLIGFCLLKDIISTPKIVSIINVVISALSFVSVLVLSFTNHSFLLSAIISSVGTLTISVLIMIAFFKCGQKNAKICCFFAAVLVLIVVSLSGLAGGYASSIGLISMIGQIPLSVAYFFLGKYLEKRTPDSFTTNISTDDNYSNIVKISKLNDLREKGIITQEEFEEKKKHIMG